MLKSGRGAGTKCGMGNNPHHFLNSDLNDFPKSSDIPQFLKIIRIAMQKEGK